MKTRELGRSGLVVSAIGLWSKGMSANCGQPADKAEMIALLRKVVDLGVTASRAASALGAEKGRDAAFDSQNYSAVGNLTPNGRQRIMQLDGKIRRGRAILYFELNGRFWRKRTF